jgi:hypothetical protein
VATKHFLVDQLIERRLIFAGTGKRGYQSMVNGKIITGIAMLTALLGASTSFAYTECSDATGANRYEDNNYRGGPMPQPTTVIDDVKIYLNGKLASESTTLRNGTKTLGPWEARFEPSTKTVIDSPNNWVENYSIRVSINPTRTLPASPIFWMICHRDDTPVP